MSLVYKKQIPILICAIMGITALIQYYIAWDPIVPVYSSIMSWFTSIFSFSMLLGVVTLCIVHANRIMKRQHGRWPFSILLFAVFFVTVAVGLAWGTGDEYYVWLTRNLMQAVFIGGQTGVGFTMLVMLYRGFRVRNLDAGIMLVMAILAVFGMTTFGEVVSPVSSQISAWLYQNMIAAGERALALAAVLGTIRLGMSTLFGYESGWLGGD